MVLDLPLGTHKALIDSDITTGRKRINQYVVLEEIGRGMHGKVKLARDTHTGENVAIKIIPRFSKKRRLGKVTAMPQQDKTKKEIAILKKIRHPNVVALLEIIDDPVLQKIYMVLEHVELGEVVWRKKGLPYICQYERHRIERETRGEPLSPEEQQYSEILERRQRLKELKRAKMSLAFAGSHDFWSIEHGAGDDSSAGSQSRVPSQCDLAMVDRIGTSMPNSLQASRATSRAPSRTHSAKSLGHAALSDAEDAEDEQLSRWESADDADVLGSTPASLSMPDGATYGPYVNDGFTSVPRRPSMADSIISHMSSVDFNPQPHDPFVDDFSYVPCFTVDQARTTFRDTVLGLEYLHYQGVVHRDIKPANLLCTKDHRVKISDFGVSYFGRPIRDGEPDDTVPESEAKDFDDDLELAKTVGTPAFFAPELCYTDPDQKVQPKVSKQIDVWSLGVTLYCLIYARIPFLAEDEFQMFRKIANDPVYIPRRRLRPVDPSTSPSGTSLYKRKNSDPYRDDNELLYEEVDDGLADLLSRMLTKDPEKRIRVREIKRHPWVVEGIPDLDRWLSDTDPARPSRGRKIEVDEREMSDAVVPLTLMERAKSTIRKVVGKVIHPLVERGDSRSARRRATSSVTSVSTDALSTAPQTPQAREGGRRFDSTTSVGETAQAKPAGTGSLPVTPRDNQPPYDPLATVLGPSGSHHLPTEISPRRVASPGPPAPRLSATPPPPAYRPHRHAHTKSIDPSYLSTIPDNTTSSDAELEKLPRPAKTASWRYWDGPYRARSVDGLHAGGPAKRDAESLLTKHLKADARPPLSSPLLSSTDVDGHQASPNANKRRSMIEGTIRPPPTRRSSSTANRRSLDGYRQESPMRAEQPQTAEPIQFPTEFTEPKTAADTESPSGGSPQEAYSMPAQDHTASITTASSRSASMDTVESPITTPGDRLSPVTSCKTSSANMDHMLSFQSDPSLPALLSGASSVSADLEGELLCRPGVVNTKPPLLETTDSVTPPAAEKEPVSGFPLEVTLAPSQSADSGIIKVPVAPRDAEPHKSGARDGCDDSESDSEDEGLTMMTNRRRSAVPGPVKGGLTTRRRDTNASVDSADTAKKA
ncbi:related to protein kinase PAK1 [Cephalotrichum gorgonifer]|uniref:non-specific serine/threonine protein kinase n=1 Tax=Cephalotrichum gorgonifer TaxID=2041049 RepID=A0AAE8N194_9PEZI|nr:related to protein kinase PAK1 [Cephalotrichum gorgonifer]